MRVSNSVFDFSFGINEAGLLVFGPPSNENSIYLKSMPALCKFHFKIIQSLPYIHKFHEYVTK